MDLQELSPSADEQDPVEWLRAQVEDDLAVARSATWKGEIADCEAKLAIIGRCEALLPPGAADLDEHYQDGRDPDEIMRDEALADLADDTLALLADSYRHRPGWAGHWACPGCGKAMHEVPDGHATGISMADGTWSCNDPVRPGGISPEEFMAGLPRLYPGARVTVKVAYGDERFGTMPPPAGTGFTVTGDGDRPWRSVVISGTDDPQARRYSIELEVRSRYPENAEL